jgi:flagellar basal-body rod modification protein FlgD
MMGMSVSKVNPLTTAQEVERTPTKQLDKQAFLSLLAAQLQYQDPLSGGDNTQYIAQMAQFSSLEQMQNLNSSISELVYFQYIQYGSQMVGKNVTINDGEQRIQGVVEKVNMQGGQINIVVNGTQYMLHQVEEISLAEEVL